jgi:hypothetical protein
MEAGGVKFMWVGASSNDHEKNNYKKCRQVRPVRKISTKFLRNSITTITQMVDQFIDNDPDFEGSSKARQGVLKMISCYRRLFVRENSKDNQLLTPTS